jgi:GNAT superfamily N-acetyltransferase
MAATAERTLDQMAGEVIRGLKRSDHDRLLRHFLGLGAEDRQRRFGGHTAAGSVRAYCARLDPHRSVILGGFIAGELRGVGELKLIGGSRPRMAELAVSVEAPYRGRGLGTELCRRLAVRARNRFVAEAHMLCLLDNQGVQRIARKLGGALTFHQGAVEAQIELPWPDPLTALEELLDETGAMPRHLGSAADRSPLHAALWRRNTPVASHSQLCGES